MARPRRQVVIWVTSTNPTSSGNQPPWGILGMFADRNARSTIRSGTTTTSAFGSGQPQRSTTTQKSSVVMAIVAVTAMPYAPARLLEVWKPSTRPTQPIISSQLTSGT